MRTSRKQHHLPSKHLRPRFPGYINRKRCLLLLISHHCHFPFLLLCSPARAHTTANTCFYFRSSHVRDAAQSISLLLLFISIFTFSFSVRSLRAGTAERKSEDGMNENDKRTNGKWRSERCECVRHIEVFVAND